MSKTTFCTINNMMIGQGYIISLINFVEPVVIECPKDMSGMDSFQAIFVLSLNIRNKFRAESFVDQFSESSKFIKAHIRNDNKHWELFDSKEYKLLKTNKLAFYTEFKDALINDLKSYHFKYGRQLAKKMIIEVNKINL